MGTDDTPTKGCLVALVACVSGIVALVIGTCLYWRTGWSGDSSSNTWTALFCVYAILTLSITAKILGYGQWRLDTRYPSSPYLWVYVLIPVALAVLLLMVIVFGPLW